MPEREEYEGWHKPGFEPETMARVRRIIEERAAFYTKRNDALADEVAALRAENTRLISANDTLVARIEDLSEGYGVNAGLGDFELVTHAIQSSPLGFDDRSRAFETLARYHQALVSIANDDYRAYYALHPEEKP